MFNKNYNFDYNPKFASNDDVASMIPVTGHISDKTLICKNGELVQTIVIDGFSNLKLGSYQEILNLRRELRSAILDIFQDPSYAIYIHTIRSRRNITPGGAEPHGFADELNRKWTIFNNWDKQLCNTLYISIVKQSSSVKATNVKDFFSSLLYPLLKSKFFKESETNELELTDLVEKLLKRLEKFGARQLKMKKTDDGYLSENLELYHQLVHLSQKNTYAPVRDYSKYLSHTTFDYHFNHIVISSHEPENQKYAAVFTIKDISEVDIEEMDQLLHMGSEFVITQVMYFVNSHKALKTYEHVHKIINYGKSESLLHESGHEEYYNSNDGFANDFCRILTTITIFADSEVFFKEKVKNLVKNLTELGLVTVREDFSMAMIYWSQLPGNFRFLHGSRMHYLNTSRSCHFASLFNHESGNFLGSKWGSPLTLLRSVKGTPFYLNFHNRSGNGNTLLVSPIGAGKTILTRFLIAQSFKYSPTIINIDVDRDSREFFEVFGGINIKVSSHEHSDIKINPFDPNLFDNRADTIREWLHRSIYPATVHLPQYIEFFSVITSHLMSADSNISRLEIIRAAIENTDDEFLKKGFEGFLGTDQFLNLFNEEHEDISKLVSNRIINIDISDLLENSMVYESYIGILLYKLITILDGGQTIIVINNLSKIMKCGHFANNLFEWLDKLKSRNALALINMNRDEALEKQEYFKKALTNFGSLMFLSDKYADKYFRRNFNLTENELNNIKSYEKKRHIFLFKQDEMSVSLQLDLSKLPEELAILSLGEVQ